MVVISFTFLTFITRDLITVLIILFLLTFIYEKLTFYIGLNCFDLNNEQLLPTIVISLLSAQL